MLSSPQMLFGAFISVCRLYRRASERAAWKHGGELRKRRAVIYICEAVLQHREGEKWQKQQGVEAGRGAASGFCTWTKVFGCCRSLQTFSLGHGGDAFNEALPHKSSKQQEGEPEVVGRHIDPALRMFLLFYLRVIFEGIHPLGLLIWLIFFFFKPNNTIKCAWISIVHIQ